MGLKITRTAKVARAERVSLRFLSMSGQDASSLVSARHLYTAATSHLPQRTVPTVLEQVRPDRDGCLDAQAVAKLFNQLWKRMGGHRDVDVILDMSDVHTVASRFARELAFLRRHLSRQNRRVLLSGVRCECSYLLDIS